MTKKKTLMTAMLPPEQIALIRDLEKTAAIYKMALEDLAVDAWDVWNCGVPRERVLHATGLTENQFRALMEKMRQENLE